MSQSIDTTSGRFYHQRRTKDLTIKKERYLVSEDYEGSTINTWLHQWNKSKNKWEWISCSNKPYEEVIEELVNS